MVYQQARKPSIYSFKNMEVAPSNSLFFDKRSDGWVGQSWKEVALKLTIWPNFSISIGIKADDKVMISSENRSEWAIANIAIMSIGAVAVPAYTTLTQSDYEFLIQHSETRCIFTSSGKLAETLRLAAEKVGNVEYNLF